MTRFSSFYLNFLRGFAAICVFLSHVFLPFFSGDLYGKLNLSFGSNCVMVFFVLSGFLIAYSVEKKNNLNEYLIDRFSRLYTIIVPALIVTLIIDLYGIYYSSLCYQNQFNPDYYYLRYLIALLNVQELWGLSSKVSTNSPFWSLSYEFWYYIIFGVAFYLKGKKRIWFTLLVVFVTGYKILLLMPIWLMGVLAYKINNRFHFKTNVCMFVITLLVTIFYLFGIFDMPFQTYFQYAHKPLYASSDFLNDWYLGLFVALNIYFSKAIEISVKPIIQSIFKWVADGTFTLYLFHFPILLFIACVIEFHPDSYITSMIVNFIVIIALMFAGNYLETKRPFYKNIFENISKYMTSSLTNAKK